MTALGILVFAVFVTAMTGLLVQVLLDGQRSSFVRRQQQVLNAQIAMHDVTEAAMRAMLEEALRVSVAEHYRVKPPTNLQRSP